MLLLDSDGRRIRRSIGFLPEYRTERETPAELEFADAVGSDEIDFELDDEDPN